MSADTKKAKAGAPSGGLGGSPDAASTKATAASDDTAKKDTAKKAKKDASDVHVDTTGMTEDEMVEAAIRAGEQAAADDMKADLDAKAAEADELREKVEQLESDLESAKADLAAATDRTARLQADWENYRKRTAEERLVERERASEKLVESLLPIIDDLERAIDHARKAAEGNDVANQLADGVDAVHTKFIDTLGKEGVEVIDPAGEAFDPLQHQAVGRAEDSEAYEETVKDVYQKGYRMAGKVIRPAMVTVTYGGPKRPAETEEDSAAEDDAGPDPEGAGGTDKGPDESSK
jgi:molecular chaperone GrpE